MPIFAVVRVSETSVKTGAPEGKELPTATVLATPLTEIAAVVPEVDEPSRDGGASGVEPAAIVVVAGGVVDEELSDGGFIIFIVRGTWTASSPSSNTPPTARKIFCRLAFALGSNFFFAISSTLRPRPSPPSSWARESWWWLQSS